MRHGVANSPKNPASLPQTGPCSRLYSGTSWQSGAGHVAVETDAKLVRRARQGDLDAFGTLAERYERALLALALAKLHDIHAAEDVVQTTLLLSFRRLHSLRDDSKFGPWTCAIARAQVADVLRSRRIPVRSQVGGDEIESTVEPASQRWIEHQHLLSLITRLPDADQILIGQRFFDGLSLADIAVAAGRPIGSITKQLSRAIARLRLFCETEGDQ